MPVALFQSTMARLLANQFHNGLSCSSLSRMAVVRNSAAGRVACLQVSLAIHAEALLRRITILGLFQLI
jgi:hypothetical protein